MLFAPTFKASELVRSLIYDPWGNICCVGKVIALFITMFKNLSAKSVQRLIVHV